MVELLLKDSHLRNTSVEGITTLVPKKIILTLIVFITTVFTESQTGMKLNIKQ